MNSTKKLTNKRKQSIKIPRGLRRRISEIMGCHENSITRIANGTTKSELQRERLKKAIITALHEEVDKIGK